MPNLLSFSKQSRRLKKNQSELRFYELQDDGLSIEGKHPRRGDICSVYVGERVLGELHIVCVEGQVTCGRLFYEGRDVVLTFQNPAYQSLKEDEKAVEIVGHVENFYCVTEGDIETGLRLSDGGAKRTAGERALAGKLLKLETSPLRLAGASQDSIVNWRADPTGHIMFVSEIAQTLFDPSTPPRTWSYIRLVHPEQRRAVAKAWLDSVSTGRHFDVTCVALLSTGYQTVRNMAVPVRNPTTGKNDWVGTLHLLGRTAATGS